MPQLAFQAFQASKHGVKGKADGRRSATIDLLHLCIAGFQVEIVGAKHLPHGEPWGTIGNHGELEVAALRKFERKLLQDYTQSKGI